MDHFDIRWKIESEGAGYGPPDRGGEKLLLVGPSLTGCLIDHSEALLFTG